jgi:hypothetical protein
MYDARRKYVSKPKRLPQIHSSTAGPARHRGMLGSHWPPP